MLPRDEGGTLRLDNAGLAEGGGPALDEDGGRLPEPAGGGAPAEGTLPELAALLEPLGGGGVARTVALLFGSFLLTHFFRSVS